MSDADLMHYLRASFILDVLIAIAGLGVIVFLLASSYLDMVGRAWRDYRSKPWRELAKKYPPKNKGAKNAKN
ncbi:MAG: hypothetical protein WC130_04920 [Kiritimatiellia bacterium]